MAKKRNSIVAVILAAVVLILGIVAVNALTKDTSASMVKLHQITTQEAITFQMEYDKHFAAKTLKKWTGEKFPVEVVNAVTQQKGAKDAAFYPGAYPDGTQNLVIGALNEKGELLYYLAERGLCCPNKVSDIKIAAKI